MRRALSLALPLLFLTLFHSVSAHADAVDGDWCYTDGRGFTIDGPRIRTPGGQQVEGDYDRHSFRYTIPEGEKDAGTHVLMVQWSEQELRIWYAAEAPVRREGEPEIWGRCRRQMS